MLRVLITVSPRMHREFIALAVHRLRPGLDVRVASPGAAQGETVAFRPHLLVRNESGAPVSAGVICRVEVLHSDGYFSRARRLSLEDLLGILDRAAGEASGG